MALHDPSFAVFSGDGMKIINTNCRRFAFQTKI